MEPSSKLVTLLPFCQNLLILHKHKKILELKRISEPFNAMEYFQPNLTFKKTTCSCSFEEETFLIVQYGDQHMNQHQNRC